MCALQYDRVFVLNDDTHKKINMVIFQRLCDYKKWETLFRYIYCLNNCASYFWHLSSLSWSVVTLTGITGFDMNTGSQQMVPCIYDLHQTLSHRIHIYREDTIFIEISSFLICIKRYTNVFCFVPPMDQDLTYRNVAPTFLFYIKTE